LTIDNDDQLQALKEIGRIVRQTLDLMQAAVRPGISTLELDAMGERNLIAKGARSAPQLAYNFPMATCISVNDEIAHGIASDQVLVDGDIVNIDVSAEKGGFYGDAGRSIPVGSGHENLERMCRDTKKAMNKAVWSTRAGQRINAIGRLIEKEATRGGYNVIPDLCGHGVGAAIHEEPQVPNIHVKENREKLHHGLVLTIEPFFTHGSGDIYEADDGWTLKTCDGSIAAQYEHTFVVTKGQPIILT
jgi:methionyl aminopeptidase